MPRQIIPYQKHLKERARELRNNSTQSEIILWMHLKGKKIRGYDFHRQKPLSYFIVDFFCNELMLAIEVDGISHTGMKQEDLRRQKHLEKIGIRFLRFTDDEVQTNTEEVLQQIEKWVDENK
jgi:very-short-patch-repair endonuclease